MMPVLITDLPENFQKLALEAFAKLADSQRGAPEFAGGGGPLQSNPAKLNATGLWTFLTEHVGDLTHRMSQRRCENINYGIEMIDEKCRKCLRILTSSYGVEREIKENLKNNYDYRTETSQTTLTFDQWVEDWKRAGQTYANAHKKLTVYNRAQFTARQAAIAIGLLDYRGATAALEWLYDQTQNGDWKAVAGSVIFDDTGKLLTYEEWPKS